MKTHAKGILIALIACSASCRSAAGATPQPVERESKLEEARRRFVANPHDENTSVWLGRRLAYDGRFDQAVEAYTSGLELHPRSYRLLRHRGHRYISTRRFDLAVADLSRAVELAAGQPNAIEEDGLPNARNIPIGTTHGNIYYHLGLAHYLKGEFAEALKAFDVRAERLDRNDDNLCSTSYWRYLILRRLDRQKEAAAVLEPITEDLEIIENFAYHELLLLYKGLRTPADFLSSSGDGVHSASIENATQAYGVSMWFHLSGADAKASGMWRDMQRDPAAAYAFGTIAAEAELARIDR